MLLMKYLIVNSQIGVTILEKHRGCEHWLTAFVSRLGIWLYIFKFCVFFFFTSWKQSMSTAIGVVHCPDTVDWFFIINSARTHECCFKFSSNSKIAMLLKRWRWWCFSSSTLGFKDTDFLWVRTYRWSTNLWKQDSHFEHGGDGWEKLPW